MRIYDYFCEKCSTKLEDVLVKEATDKVSCSCGGEMTRLPSFVKSYTIWGDNSASITPKKHRRGANDPALQKKRAELRKESGK